MMNDFQKLMEVNDFQKLMEVIVKKRDNYLKETGMFPDTITINEEQCQLIANYYSSLEVKAIEKKVENEIALYICNMKINIDNNIKTSEDITTDKRRWG